MTGQTVDKLYPLLSMLQQPAFCIRKNGSILSHQAARHLAPASAAELPRWLGDGAELWAAWDQESTLDLPVCCGTETYRAAIEALDDGTLFLMSSCTPAKPVQSVLTVSAQVLRQPLNDLAALLQMLADAKNADVQPDRIAAIQRQVHRLTRITANMADLEHLQTLEQPRLEFLDINTRLISIMQEVEELCKYLDRPLRFQPLAKNVSLQADPVLVERALLNLITNAIRFGKAGTPIDCWIEATASAVLLRVRNHCSQDNSELLRAAFSRLSQRDLLPDPRWGVGLGLPLVYTIARLHNGTAAVEAHRDGTATVTISLSRRRTPRNVGLKCALPYEYTGGMRRTLVELSDVLPNRCYEEINL